MSIQGKDITRIVKKYPLPSACLLVLIIAVMAFYLRTDLLIEANSKLEERSTELKRYKTNLAASAQLDTQLLVLQKANAQLQASAIHITELAKNPQFFYSLEKETGVKISDVRQMATSAAKGPLDAFIVVPFTIVAEGEYINILNFLKRLEYGNNIVKISTASLDPFQQTKLSLTITVDVLGLR